jgi:hypothetical protein
VDDRSAFLDDAQRLFREIGEALKSDGTVLEYSVRMLPSRVLGYAGEVVGNFFDPERRFAVTLTFSHTEDEVKTRPDGVGGYAHYRRMMKGSSNLDVPKPEDRRALYGSYPEALLQLVKVMLADHPVKRELETKAAV